MTSESRILPKELKLTQLVQGACIETSDDHLDCDVLVAVSHSCDIRRSMDTEPDVEFVKATWVDNLDGSYTNAKNPRILHLKQPISGFEGNLELRILNRVHLAKTDTSVFKGALFSEHSSSLLRRWMSLRYERSAFPDAFNRKLNSQSSKLRKLTKRHAQNVSAIYLTTSPDELPDGTPYRVEVVFGMLVENYEDSELREKVVESLDSFVEILTRAGHEVTDSVVLSESEITMDDLRYMTRWVQDDLSLRDELPTPPSGT